MKNKKTYRMVSTLNYLSSVCFYIAAIFGFVNGNSGMATVYLCLGSAFLCLGTVWSNKANEKDGEKDKSDE